MYRANCVSDTVKFLSRGGSVTLDAYLLTRLAAESELKSQGIPFQVRSVDKWTHIFKSSRNK